ncbi:MAG: ribose 5-phosphate isomerase B [Leptolyngbya sp. PLA2]|nr:ribose 5-phosphate isomerase B [Leptolyngbya sp.]MCE7971700.1 ribose 5-phosphate isomerase B [Leptolyngbya sp. PL-A2]MCZ7634341.1 ribose 5-phosphate isomerase B [Phycisphaerales bacterium]MDL1904861.1 ribose 5-phosphate isomerase B [Synechococcales cyanobacterium CNB]GIK19654.1 MAG: ribose 5-phosphate isomerase B [Planctomycetota bacterium]
MKIALGADHRGHAAVRTLLAKLSGEGHEVQLLGDCGGEVCDYPEPAWLVARAVASGQAERGVLICGTGIGMSIAANKVPGVRAAVVHDELTAQLCRSHNDANVICLSGDLLGVRLIEKIVDVFLRTPFDGGRHARRISKIEAMEHGREPSSVTD